MRDSTGIVARVHTGRETRAFDRRAIEEFSIPGIRLMLRAGRVAFDTLRQRWPHAGIVTVVCGAGNNGGDGYIIAGLARDAGLAVQLIELEAPAKFTGDAHTARAFAIERLGEVGDNWPVRGDVVVDAMLGTGASGQLRESYQAAARRINDAGKPVLAVDVPTGVDADTGGLFGDPPVRADVTVTFVARKLGLATGPAVDCVGDVVFDDLGIGAAVCADAGVAVLDGAGLAALTRRPNAHKGDFGHLLVVGGELDMGGAVLLTGEAALRAGAGLVTVATRAANRPAILARRPELMVRATETPADLADRIERATAIVVGPGIGTDAWGRRLVARCLEAGKPLVVDADGLNILANTATPPNRQNLPHGAIITPHPGEAGRLLGTDAAWVQERRPAAAAELSHGGLVAVLKGAGTLVAADGALRSICLGGNAGMATAGSGDVLSGICAGLLARGLSPTAAAELGVWLHARAGDEAACARRAALLAGDIVDALRLTP